MTTPFLDMDTVFDLLDNQPEAVIYYTPIFNGVDSSTIIVDFKVAYCNKQAAFLTNTSVDQLLAQRVHSMLNTDEETKTLLFNQLVQVYQSGEPLEANYFNPVLEKHFNTLRTKVKEGVLTVARNQSNEVWVQQERQRQTLLTDTILDASINGVFALEAVRNERGTIIDFRFVKFNQKFLKVVGKRDEEVMGKSYLSILPPSKDNGLFELKCHVVESGESIEKEFCYKGAGVDGWYLISMAPLGTNGVVETFTDITESKRNKESVEQAALRLETVVNTSKAGMFTLLPVSDEQGEVVDFRFGVVNQAVATYIGQTAEVLKGSLGSIYFPAYQTNGLFDIYKDNYLNGTPYNFDFHYEDGYDVFFNIDVVKMGDEVLVTFTDHTKLKRLQRDLEAKVEELGRSNKNLEEFAHAASHDLKEPLRKIRTFADRLKTKLSSRLDETETALFDRMEASSERMQLLVDDLLEFSHVSQNPRQMELVNLNDKIQKVLADLELPIEEKGANFQIGELPSVKGYRRQLQQLFQNLLSNALKYSKPGVPPEITVRSQKVKGADASIQLPLEQREQPFYLIEVSDNGIGFEPEYAEKIFGMFQRLHGKAEYAGTGVGLSIARKVVENHNGFIWATSELGKGATFSVLLPV